MAFEQNMKNVLRAVESQSDIILFIDEIHTILGAGSAEGNLDAANILKPALARGRFRALGATTTKEYQIFEKDAALARLFQRVLVDKPKLKDVAELLRYTKEKFEKYHEVSVPNELIEDLVKLSDKFVRDRNFPDKAFDILDESLSQYSMKRTDDVKDPTYLSELTILEVNYLEIQAAKSFEKLYTEKVRFSSYYTSSVRSENVEFLHFFAGKAQFLIKRRIKYLKANIYEKASPYPLLPIDSVHKVIFN